MCVLCDGTNEEDLLTGFRSRVTEFGFTMVSVGGSPSSWTYTIGLLENLGHPELVVTGLDPSSAYGIITGLVTRIRAGEMFTGESEDTTHEGVPVRFGGVHRSQWAHGRFAMWEAYYDAFGGAPLDRAATQIMWPNEHLVFPPDRDFCHEHRNCQPLLAFATPVDVNLTRRQRVKRAKKRR